uniref:Uncharacterized protein n=1 Tax=Globodera rostochiensis TaxID=31243 RepID=A0A914HP79_GLORO
MSITKSTDRTPKLDKLNPIQLISLATDQLGQIEPNSTDQNPPFIESDHKDERKRGKVNLAKPNQINIPTVNKRN